MEMRATEVCCQPVRTRSLLLALWFSLGAAQVPLQDGRRLSWGSFTADSSNPTFPPQQKIVDPADRSSLVVEGVIETFLHKEHLEPGELECLKQGMGDLAGEVTSVSENAMVLVQEVLGGKNGISHKPQGGHEAPAAPQIDDGAGSISAMVDSMQAEEQEGPPAPPHEESNPAPASQAVAHQPKPVDKPAHKEASKSLALFYGSRRLQMAAMAMSAPVLFMNLGYTAKHMAHLVSKILDKCVKGDARVALQTAGSHLLKLRYIEGRLIANGADIVTELANALQTYQKEDFKSFGQNMGRVFRKVLLSNNADGTLPEGLPSKTVVANVTAGVLRGFFGQGFALNIQTDPGYDPVHIDLHRCVGRNLAFFQSLWGATMLFYSKQDMQGRHTVSPEEKPSWGAALAMTMMQLPTALRKCDIGEEERGMLMDSIKQLGAGLHYNVEYPEKSQVHEDKIANDMATTVKDWARTDYYTFGEHLGHLLQEMFVTVYGQKWSVDSRGTLRKRLVEMAEVGNPAAGATLGGFLHTHGKGVVLVASAPLLASLMMLSVRRGLKSHKRFQESGECDPEAQE